MADDYLISYPRSGNTWLRYCIEIVSGRPTNGAMDNPKDKLAHLIHPGEDFILHKEHTWPDNINKAILLVRNYKECLLRHQDGRPMRDGFFKKLTSGKSNDYIGLIKLFDEFKGKKLLVYYEDLLDTPIWQMNKVCEFLSLPEKVITEKDRQDCLKIYTKSQTKGEHKIFHSLKLGAEAQKWDESLQSRWPKLFNKYLERYI